MPRTSKAASASSKSKVNSIAASPDTDITIPEPELPSRSSKKRNKNAAAKQSQTNSPPEPVSDGELTFGETGVQTAAPTPIPVSAPARPETILSQIPLNFSVPTRSDNLVDIDDDEDEILPRTEKVSDQYTPPNDKWFEEAIYDRSPPVRPIDRIAQTASPPAEPGFSTSHKYDAKSPPKSPRPRNARPISYGSAVNPVSRQTRVSTSPYGYAPSAFGSPPAPHLPQPHFYQPQDVNLGLPFLGKAQGLEEPSLIRYAKLPLGHSSQRQGVLLGFEGRLNILRLENGTFNEIGVIDGLPGTVLDAAILECASALDSFADIRPLIALIIHGPLMLDSDSSGNAEDERQTQLQPGRHSKSINTNEYTTRVVIFSLSTHEYVTTLLESPVQIMQPSFRGAQPTPPTPVGNLRLQTSGDFLVVSSGSSGEVFAFAMSHNSPPTFECIGKFWSSIQPQVQRRDSSHHLPSDADVSPADLGRAAGRIDRAISSICGRWLAICPQGNPSRPSIGLVIGQHVRCSKLTGVEAKSAPARPYISCEVDSPDADTLFGKVARGVAQELVKGAKWLGDQGYQTWQNYWKKEASPPLIGNQMTYSPPVHTTPYVQGAFPPTHADPASNPKEPELVAIYDLQALHMSSSKRNVEEIRPLATFQPPRGCSFISFAPQGLSMLTAGRKGDVQYVWDLMQIKNCRALVTASEDERLRAQPRVRQIAKYERLSGSTIVDTVWDPNGSRFAVLTKNKTIHLFDLPTAAFRWPPPRIHKKTRSSSKPTDSNQPEAPAASGFFASAMNIANQAQPVIANWRGRAPSMGGGLAGIGQTGIGFASATGVKGGRAVAAGLSRSLGAASETVSQMRHAGESRLHLKSNKELVSGRIFWMPQGRTHIFAILEADMIKQYQVRKSKGHDKRDRESATVFEARKALLIKFPRLSSTEIDTETSFDPSGHAPRQRSPSGFWNLGSPTAATNPVLLHPLSFAEIETNAPYQPFHSDRRVNLSVYTDKLSRAEHETHTASLNSQPRRKAARSNTPWVFGDDIPSIKLNVHKLHISDDENTYAGSVMYRETTTVTSPTDGDDQMEQIVSTTRRRKVKKQHGNPDEAANSDPEREDGFFEDDCDVLDFATDRV